MMIEIPAPECQYGYSSRQLREALPGNTLDKFANFMRGRTMAICDGAPQREWRSVQGATVLVEIGPPSCDRPHGAIVHQSDFERFVNKGGIID